MWPKTPGSLWVDGWSYWPDGIEHSEDVSFFIKAFEQKGYCVCDNSSFEDGFRKVALYVKKDTTECTHAARQLSNGKWTSKLDPSYDICHSSPYTIQGRLYVMVAGILSRKAK